MQTEILVDRQAHNLTKRSVQLHIELKGKVRLFASVLTLCNQSNYRYVASVTQGFASERHACLSGAYLNY